MVDDRVQLTVEEAMARLAVIPDYDSGDGSGPHVHCQTNPAPGLFMGAHWSVADVRALFQKHGAEEPGPMATGMGYGVVSLTPRGPRFFATRRMAD